MRKLRTALLAAATACTAIIAPVIAAPAAQAVDTGYITIYKDHNDLGGELYRWSITGGCWGGRYITADILTYEIQRASSIRFLAGGRNNQDCNYLKVRSHSNGWWYWGQCVNVLDWDFNFGTNYNDNSDAWVLEYNPNCRLYYL